MSYTAVNLAPESVAKLNSRFPLCEGWTRKTHHMTVHMGPHNDGDLPIGTKVRLVASAVGTNGRAMAVKVITVPVIPCANPIPHVTLAVNSGCKPVESNNIKVWQDIKPIELSGTIEQNG